jgi:hypothetical protein
MGEPVSERAHYMVSGETAGRADLLLFQDGRVQSSGLVPVIWKQGGSGKATDAFHIPHRLLSGLWWGFSRPVV